MATSFDLGGLLGSAFGGDEYGDLLTPAQQSAIQQRALLSAASALLQAGAPSTTRTSLGQALGAALTAGQTGAEKAQQSALTGMLTRQKLEEARREQERDQQFRNALLGMSAVTSPALTAEQALAAPGMAAGPTVERAALVGQPAPAGMAAQGASQLTPQQVSLLSTLPRKEAAAEILKMTKPQEVEVVGSPYKVGNRIFQQTKRGVPIEIPSAVAPEIAPEVVGSPYRVGDRTFQQTKSGTPIEIPSTMAPTPTPTGAPFEGRDQYGKTVFLQQYTDGIPRVIERVGPPRKMQEVSRGGVKTFVDVNEIAPGTNFPVTLAPQVVGGAESGFFVVGGGGGGGGAAAPRALAAGAPATAPVAAPSAPVARTPAAGAAATAPAGAQPAAAKPTGPQPIIPGTGAAFKNEETLRREFTTTMEPYVKLAQAYKKIETAATNVSGAGDVSLIYGYMKILDPGSTVMQGEQATAANAGSVPATIRSFYNRALTGERLDPTVRNDFLAQARNIIESQRELSNDVVSRYRRLAEEYDLKPNRITFDPFQNIKTPEQIIRGSTPPASGTTTPVPTTQRGFFDRFNLIPR